MGLLPLGAAVACWRLAARRPEAAVACFTGAALVYTALAVGPAAGRLAAANTIPGFVRSLERQGDDVRLGTFMIASPNVVFYASGRVNQIVRDDVEAATRFLTSGPDTILLVSADRLGDVQAALPPGIGELGRARPMFRAHDVVALGRIPPADRTAGLEGSTR